MTARIECCPYTPQLPRGQHNHRARVEALIRRAIAAVEATLTTAVCAHLDVVRAVFEAPVRAIVNGLAIECPECAVIAYVLGKKLVDAAVLDVARSCRQAG